MPSICENLKEEYEELQSQGREFRTMYEAAMRTGDLASAKNFKAELETKRNTLKEKLIISVERAKEIMGQKNVLGAAEVARVFGVGLEQIPPIPFSRRELENAKELNQFLILRINKTPDGKPLTMQAMNSVLQERFAREGKGKLVYSGFESWVATDQLYMQDTPELGWALVSRESIPDSTSKNYLEQTELLIKYAKEKIFEGGSVPSEYELAIAEFEKQKDDIATILSTDWKQAGKRLTELTINQMLRHSPATMLYDVAMQFDINGDRLLPGSYTWTNRLVPDGDVIYVGDFGADGLYGYSRNPVNPHSDIGVLCSRSL